MNTILAINNSITSLRSDSIGFNKQINNTNRLIIVLDKNTKILIQDKENKVIILN